MARFAFLVALGLLGACEARQPVDNGAQAGRPAAVSNDVAPLNASATPGETAEPVPDEMKGEAGARHVLALWADALERGDWRTARAQWGDHGAMSGRSPEQYAAQYNHYRQMKVEVGRGEADAGAGSLFYTAPVTVSGITGDGKPFAGTGAAYLRRVNDVPGASAEQLRWHIERLDFGVGTSDRPAP